MCILWLDKDGNIISPVGDDDDSCGITLPRNMSVAEIEELFGIKGQGLIESDETL